jgi:phosphotransferase system  glucose/maltose/N-acetylglucosamine-specific IIC component
MMKKYLKLYSLIYAIASPSLFVLALGIMRRHDVSLGIGVIFLGGVLISFLITSSIGVFKKTWGNGVWNVIIGYLIMFPIPFILKRMYGDFLFRRTYFIYLIGFIYALIYSLIILYTSRKNKINEDQLNELLKEKENNESVD